MVCIRPFFIVRAVKSLYTGFSCEYGANTGRHSRPFEEGLMTDQSNARTTWRTEEKWNVFWARGYKRGYRKGLHFSEKGVTKVGFGGMDRKGGKIPFFEVKC